MPGPEKPNQNAIVKHALLIGITPLIPIPFVDDWAKSYLQGRMVRDLAELRATTLSPQVVQVLVADNEGCLPGCLGTVILYPIKAVFRKLAFFLEWQRAANLVTHIYYYGYLLDVALQEGWLSSADVDQAGKVRTAIDRARKGANTRLLRQVVDQTFKISRDRVKDAVRRLSKTLKRARAGDADQGGVDEGDPSPAEESVKEIAGQLQAGIANMPSDHFVTLIQRLKAEYARL